MRNQCSTPGITPRFYPLLHERQRMKSDLVIIDPQVDFCDPNGALYVTGADADNVRLAEVIHERGRGLNDIHVTLDSHHRLDVAHPMMWRDSEGNPPNPFTAISEDDLDAGTWAPFNPGLTPRMRAYLKALKAGNRYGLTVWPEHCLIGHPGWCVDPVLLAALDEWEELPAQVDYVTKGSNRWTEHYSAVQADVPDPDDPGTQLNIPFIETLAIPDIIWIAGQALDYCLANTLRDIANNFGEENIKKIHLITDATSAIDVAAGDVFIQEMVARGMKTVICDQVLA